MDIRCAGLGSHKQIKRGCRFWAAIVLMFFTIYMPVAGAESCPLYVDSSVNKSQLEELKQKSYQVTVSPHLRFNMTSLRIHTDRKAWALQRSSGKETFYFEFADGLGGYPILKFEFKELPTCREVHARIKNFSEQRKPVVNALKILKDPTQKGLFDAILALEKLEFERRGLKYKINQTFLDHIRNNANQAAASVSMENYLEYMKAVRKSLLTDVLRHYCRDKTTLTEMSVDGCTNCVGQTALLLATYHDLGFKPPQPWKLGFAVYHDHIQPVLFNPETSKQIDLVYNQISENKTKAPIFEPTDLLKLALQKHKHLILQSDIDLYQIDVQSLNYIHRAENFFLSLINKFNSTETQPSQYGRIDAFNYGAIRSFSFFTTRPVPETADLEGLITAEYVEGDQQTEYQAEPREKSESQNQKQQEFKIFENTSLRDWAPWLTSGWDRLDVSPELAKRLKPLSHADRKKVLTKEENEFAKKYLLSDVARISELMRNESWVEDIVKNFQELRSALMRLKWIEYKKNDEMFKQSPILISLKPALINLQVAESKFFERIALYPEDFFRAVEHLNAEESAKVVDFLEIVLNLDHLRRILFSLLYNKKFIYTGPLTENERLARQSLLESVLVSPSQRSVELDLGPKVDPPQISSLNCQDKEGWIDDGLFAWKCPERPQARIAAVINGQSVTTPVREFREVNPTVLAGLVYWGMGSLYHPGHALLVHQMWSDSIDMAFNLHKKRFDNKFKSYSGFYIWNGPEGPKIFAESWWNFVGTLLSNRLPYVSEEKMAECRRQAVSESRQKCSAITSEVFSSWRSENIPWLTDHPNYLQAYLHFTQQPRSQIVATVPLLLAREATAWDRVGNGQTQGSEEANMVLDREKPSRLLALSVPFSNWHLQAHLIFWGEGLISIEPRQVAHGFDHVPFVAWRSDSAPKHYRQCVNQRTHKIAFNSEYIEYYYGPCQSSWAAEIKKAMEQSPYRNGFNTRKQ